MAKGVFLGVTCAFTLIVAMVAEPKCPKPAEPHASRAALGRHGVIAAHGWHGELAGVLPRPDIQH